MPDPDAELTKADVNSQTITKLIDEEIFIAWLDTADGRAWEDQEDAPEHNKVPSYITFYDKAYDAVRKDVLERIDLITKGPEYVSGGRI